MMIKQNITDKKERKTDLIPDKESNRRITIDTILVSLEVWLFQRTRYNTISCSRIQRRSPSIVISIVQKKEEIENIPL